MPRLQLQGRAYAPSDSSAASSVVTPLSPGVIRALRAGGIQIDSPVATTRPRDSQVDAVAGDFAEMYLHETAISLDIRDEPHIGMISRVDTNSSGFTSPIAPPGAPSDAGSLFSRAVSPKFGPTIARMTMGRSTTSGPATMSTKTRTPPITPPKTTRPAGLDETPRSQRSVRPNSPDNKGKGKGRANAPASVFSRGPGSNYSRGPELGWKLELPHHTDDPLTFHSFLVRRFWLRVFVLFKFGCRAGWSLRDTAVGVNMSVQILVRSRTHRRAVNDSRRHGARLRLARAL